MSKRHRSADANKATARGIPRHLRDLWDEIAPRGWTWGWTSRAHIRFRHPSGRVVFASGSTGNAVDVARITRRKCLAVERETQAS